MTKEEYKNLPKTSRKTLDDSLNIVTDFMTGGYNKGKYKGRLRYNITDFYCLRAIRKPKKSIINKLKRNNAIGLCIPIYKRKFIHKIFKKYPDGTKCKSKLVINDKDSNFYLSNLIIAIHEVNHADTNQYGVIKNGVIYNGLTKFYKTDNNTYRHVGAGLNECMNELYTQIQFYMKYPKCYTNIKSLDDIIYGPFEPKFINEISGAGSIYRRLTLLAKLLIIACDNDMEQSYESLRKQNNSFLRKSVLLNYGRYLVKNDLLYAGKSGFKEFEKYFNELCNNKNEFENLSLRFDYLLQQLKEGKPLDKNVIGDIIRTIDYFKDERYNSLVKAGLWDNTKRMNNELIYNSYKYKLLRIFKLLPAKVTTLNSEVNVNNNENKLVLENR